MSAAVPGSSEQNWLHGKNSSRRPRSAYLRPSAISPGTSRTSHRRATLTTRTTLLAKMSNDISSPALFLALKSVKTPKLWLAFLAPSRDLLPPKELIFGLLC
eukprot:CAMPEP_0119310772 /NCGR_PEP_ID=MMETSP1333-20130426/20123_1 /TAXON_ID=418940 /ORGANISM="Scyphosphaera apsteinii, Strain RCC1455" /LENGTH=101 /DNA_ID=CAMNT_0007315015 /DNA_START=441 /DNA_END=743 /DNA_ORIENTATION=+